MALIESGLFLKIPTHAHKQNSSTVHSYKFSSTMARTKQTARKGTNRSAHRTVKADGPLIAKKAPRKPSVDPPKRKYRY